MCQAHKYCECPGFRVERFIQPCLLLLLAQKRAHGYELLEELRSLFFQEETLDPSLVYRSLRKMEEDGLILSEWVTGGPGPARRVYTITEEGRAALDLWVEHIRKQLQRFETFLREYSDILEGREGHE
ncbi:MAG: helix-turn-helix transcriptional regulator [Atribacterota bacterium]